MNSEDIFIGSYRLISELASGAFGRVYLAQHALLTNRLAAIKLMHISHLGNAEELIRFLVEPQFLETLKHPYVLPVIDAGIYEGLPYLVTQYAAKGSLRDLLKRQPTIPLPTVEAITILSQIGQALQYAHEQNIIHRDLKPENILFNEKGDALLADFGIATMLTTASIKQTSSAGTIAYMAPEQFQDIVCKESDQYALGCVAYELFTGQPPFQAANPAALMAKCLMEQPIALRHYNPQIPEYMERAILKAISKQRTDRHADVSAFITALIKPNPGLPEKAKGEWLARLVSMTLLPGQQEKIIAACEQALKLDPTFAEAHFFKGVALNDLGRNKEALAAFELSIQLSPNDSQAWFYKGDLLNRLGRFGESERAYTRAEELAELESDDEDDASEGEYFSDEDTFDPTGMGDSEKYAISHLDPEEEHSENIQARGEDTRIYPATHSSNTGVSMPQKVNIGIPDPASNLNEQGKVLRAC